jgi:hypothetical protein
VAHFDRGNTFLDQGRLDEAIAELRAAILFRPDLFEIHSSPTLSRVR